MPNEPLKTRRQTIDPMHGVLIVVAGPHVGDTFELEHDYAVIGRGEDVDISFSEDDLVSRMHARILRTKKGFLLRDLDSANGTFVNGARIKFSAQLDPGDMVRIGSVVMRFDSDSTWTGGGAIGGTGARA